MPVSTDWTNPYPILQRMTASDGGTLTISIAANSRTANIQNINIVNTSGFDWDFVVSVAGGAFQPFTVPAGFNDVVSSAQLRGVFGRNINYAELAWGLNGVG